MQKRTSPLKFGTFRGEYRTLRVLESFNSGRVHAQLRRRGHGPNGPEVGEQGYGPRGSQAAEHPRERQG